MASFGVGGGKHSQIPGAAGIVALSEPAAPGDGMERMNHVRKVVSCLLLSCSALLTAGSVMAEEAAAAVATSEPASDEQLLDDALKSIGAGNPETAIQKFLDPLIQRYESRRAPDGPQLFSANSMIESIFYMGLAAAAARDKEARDAQVLSGAWANAIHLKGYALIDLERFDEAKVVLRQGTEIAPMHPGLWSELGAILQEEKNWPEALAAFEKAEAAADLGFDKDSKEVNQLLTRALRGQGFALIEMGKLDQAEKLYKRCLKLDPGDDVAKREMAYIKQARKAKK
jgi:tetratricopeptide (TPR) repeat protein